MEGRTGIRLIKNSIILTSLLDLLAVRELPSIFSALLIPMKRRINGYRRYILYGRYRDLDAIECYDLVEGTVYWDVH